MYKKKLHETQRHLIYTSTFNSKVGEVYDFFFNLLKLSWLKFFNPVQNYLINKILLT